MNAKDTILQALNPVVQVPSFEALPADPRPDGHRHLVARDGLWLEVVTPWLFARQPLGPSIVPLPFGETESVMDLKCGPLPRAMLEEFMQSARSACPNETAAIITWRPETGEFTLRPVALEAGTAHVHYERPRLPSGEYLVADLHSHGRHPGGFSGQDDRDDYGEVKLAVVVGQCDSENPDISVRLCLRGLFVPLVTRESAGLGVPR
jgi:PRTRC genetic system protein A